MLITVCKYLRLPFFYGVMPLYKIIAWLYRRYPNNVCIKVGRTRLIGPPELVDRCIKILDEMRVDSPALHQALTIDEKLTFSFVPWWDVGMMGTRYSCLGNEYLQWGDEGIRAFLAYAAYCVQEKLIYPLVRLDDYYYHKSVRKQTAAMRTSRWLVDHQQPNELAQYFASFGTKR